MEGIGKWNGQSCWCPLFWSQLSTNIINFVGVHCVSIPPRICRTYEYIYMHRFSCVDTWFRGGASPQVCPSIAIGIKRSSDASMPKFLCESVDSSHICIPNSWHWYGFFIDFSILFPNHKPYPNYIITTSPISRVNILTPVYIGIFTCSKYSGNNGDTVQSSEVNYIVVKFPPKQWASAWFSISFADALQIALS